MFNVIKSELYRLAKGKLIWVIIALSAAVPVLSHVALSTFGAAEEMAIFTLGDFVQGLSKELVTGGMGLVFVLLLGVNLLAEDYFSGVLKIRLLETSRFHLLLAKVVALYAGVYAFCATMMVSALVTGGFAYGFSGDGDALFIGVFQFVLAMQVLGVYGILMMGLGFLCNKTSAAIGFGLLIYTVYTLAAQLLPEPYLWAVPFGFVAKLLTTGDYDYALRSILSVGAYGFAGIAALWVLFSKRDLAV